MRKTLLVIVVFLVCLGHVSAQNELHPVYYDFFLTDYTALLFPESAYEENPAYLHGLSGPTLIGTAYGSRERYLTMRTLGPENVNADGTESWDNTIHEGSLTADFFLPIAQTMFAGASAIGGGLIADYSLTDDGFTTIGEQVVQETERSSSQWLAGGWYGLMIGDVGLGINISYGQETEPEDREYESDTAYLSGERYITSGDARDDAMSSLTGTVGAKVTAGDRAVFGLGGKYEWTQRTTDWLIAVDTDSNGEDDRLVGWKEYWSSTEPWGPGAPLPNLDFEDSESQSAITLYPSAFYDISDTVTILLSGQATPFDKTVYVDQIISDTTTDKSQNTWTENRYDYLGMAGAEILPADCVTVRAGIGVGFSGLDRTNYSLDAAGDSAFSANNPNHYEEVILGGDPDNNNVIALGDDAASSFDQSTFTLRFSITGMFWPSDRVILSTGGGFRRDMVTSNYSIFRTASDTTYTESAKTNLKEWQLDTIIGAGVFVTDGFFLGTDVRTFASGYYSMFDDMAPVSTGPDPTYVSGVFNDVLKDNDTAVSIYSVISF